MNRDGRTDVAHLPTEDWWNRACPNHIDSLDKLVLVTVECLSCCYRVPGKIVDSLTVILKGKVLVPVSLLCTIEYCEIWTFFCGGNVRAGVPREVFAID